MFQNTKILSLLKFLYKNYFEPLAGTSFETCYKLFCPNLILTMKKNVIGEKNVKMAIFTKKL